MANFNVGSARRRNFYRLKDQQFRLQVSAVIHGQVGTLKRGKQGQLITDDIAIEHESDQAKDDVP